MSLIVEPLPIMLYPSKCLTEKCTEVERDYAVEDLTNKLKATLVGTNGKGIGIAAPQVGIMKRAFIIANRMFINPVIKEYKGKTVTQSEACLSIPNVEGNVKRHKKVWVEWYDEFWNKHEKVFTNFDARVIQHEYDHLNGVQFIDHFSEEDLVANKPLLTLLEDKHVPQDLPYASCYQGSGQVFLPKQ